MSTLSRKELIKNTIPLAFLRYLWCFNFKLKNSNVLVYVYILGKMRNLSKLILLRPRLKEFIFGEVTRCVGREFHMGTTLLAKKNL